MTKRRPRIGITCNWLTEKVEQGIPVVQIQSNYTHAVKQTGGLPVPLVPLPDDGHPEAYAEMIDGLLLTGGRDMDPSQYGQECHTEHRALPPERDRFDVAVLRAVLAAGKPVLGICLGHQQVNVTLGGTLHQHLPDVIDPYEIEHRWLDRKNTPLPEHEVEVFHGTRLAEVLSESRLIANSSHHQAVDQNAPGLRPTAETADGVNEGLESVDGDQILTVQWHPEYLTAQAPHRALFADLVDRARRCAPR